MCNGLSLFPVLSGFSRRKVMAFVANAKRFVCKNLRMCVKNAFPTYDRIAVLYGKRNFEAVTARRQDYSKIWKS